MSAPFDPADPAGDSFRQAVQSAITGFLVDQRPVLAGIGEELEPLRLAAVDYTGGGVYYRGNLAKYYDIPASIRIKAR